MYHCSPLLQISGVATAAPVSSSSLGPRGKTCPRASASPNHVPHANGRNKQPAVPSAERYQPTAAQNATTRPTSHRDTKKPNRARPSSWSHRMAHIQELMNKVQEQLQQHAGLQDHLPDLAAQLKQKGEQHLDLLMQLAEAEQKHITGDMQPEQLQQVLQELQQQLDHEQQEALAALQQQPSSAASSSNSSSSSSSSSSNSAPSDSVHVQKHKQLLGATAELKEAIDRASAGLSSQQQDLQLLSEQLVQQGSETDNSDPSAAADQQKLLPDIKSRIEAAEAAISNTQQLLMDYDQMCQRAFQLSRKLSLAETEHVELRSQLAHAKAELAVAADELAEHRELQMQFDKQCQDMYKLRMMLQQAQAAGTEVAVQAAGTSKKFKQDISWLMEAHRREMAEAHRKNQELAQNTQELRMRLLEMEQQLWGQSTAASTPEASTAVEPAAAAEPVSAQQQPQPEELATLQDAVERLSQEKQQLMKSLQDMQREQAVLRMELQTLHEQQQQQEPADEQSTSADTAELQAAAASAVALQQQLEQSIQQRDTLLQQVQALQHSLQKAGDAAAAAAAVREQELTTAVVVNSSSVADADAVLAAEQELSEVKTQMIQLRGQLAETRRELATVTGRAATAEAALQQQAANYEARLQQLQTLYSRQTAVVAQLRKGKVPDAVGFRNTNRFWVRHELLFEFLKHWVVREGLLQQQTGFLGLQVEPVPGVSVDGGVDVLVSSLWESIPHWEAWAKSDAARQQHMPVGVYQYVPKKGEGFPEDFVPFRDYDDAVNAKY